MLSVICPIYNEERYIAACIESILAQDYPKDDLEVIFADGMSTDGTRGIVADYAARFPFIRLIDNPDRIVPPALNKAIEASKGDIIMRLDAHANYPSNYFSALVKALDDYDADNVGGVCLTLPTDDSHRSRAIAAVLSSRFGMGNSDFRVGVKEVKEVDTVPFGCWHREVFDRIGLFDVELIRNQDDEFNGRLRRAGGRILLIPDIKVEYYGRDTLSKLARMFYQYGLFKPLVNKKLGAPATVRQFFPPALVIGLVVGAALSLIWPPFAWVYVCGIVMYLLLALVFALQSSRNVCQVAFQICGYVIVHLSYGWGYLCGLWRLLFNRRFVARNNR